LALAEGGELRSELLCWHFSQYNVFYFKKCSVAKSSAQPPLKRRVPEVAISHAPSCFSKFSVAFSPWMPDECASGFLFEPSQLPHHCPFPFPLVIPVP
jgi:hypothetical protein